MGPADDELTGVPNGDVQALVVDDVSFTAPDGDADRCGTRLELCRRQIGAALALGEAIHREQGRRRKQLLQARDVRRRQRGRSVGDVAQRRKLARLNIPHLQEERGHRRHQREAGDTLLPDPVQDRLRKSEGLFQHKGCPEPGSHEHLIKAIVERDQQRRQDHVVGGVSEIGGDRCGPPHRCSDASSSPPSGSRSSRRCRSASPGQD